jgi:prepilin-type N-terminal cleavage/methylation domain-containing protein
MRLKGSFMGTRKRIAGHKDIKGFTRSNQRKSSSEEGFTLIEVTVTVIILGIVITVATMNYANISRGTALSGAKKQVEEALIRAKTAARQENVDYQMVFYPNDSSDHPNTYEYLHNEYDELNGTWSMQPIDKSVSGESVTEADGHWYIEVASNVEITDGETTITFNPTGTTMSVTPATINLHLVDINASVAVDSVGKVEVN